MGTNPIWVFELWFSQFKGEKGEMGKMGMICNDFLEHLFRSMTVFPFFHFHLFPFLH
jgi:hypothetical protein